MRSIGHWDRSREFCGGVGARRIHSVRLRRWIACVVLVAGLASAQESVPENDQEKDQEPVVVASAGRTVMAWMHYDATPGRSPFVHYTSSSDLLNWSTIQRIHPWEDGESGDPFLAVHPSVPANVYLVANARQFSDYRKPGGANKIVLVSSIDGGVSWTGPSTVCTTVVPGTRHQKVLDKPSVAVSSRSTVYIAHMLVDDLETGGEGIQIHVHRTGENWPYVTLSLAATGTEHRRPQRVRL